MPDELPDAPAYLLQHQHMEAKGSGEWHNHKIVTSRGEAEAWLQMTPHESASRAIPMIALPGDAVIETGLGYDYRSYGEYEAAAL